MRLLGILYLYPTNCQPANFNAILFCLIFTLTDFACALSVWPKLSPRVFGFDAIGNVCDYQFWWTSLVQEVNSAIVDFSNYSFSWFSWKQMFNRLTCCICDEWHVCQKWGWYLRYVQMFLLVRSLRLRLLVPFQNSIYTYFPFTMNSLIKIFSKFILFHNNPESNTMHYIQYNATINIYHTKIIRKGL